MSYIYAKASDLEDADKVGSEQCVALVQHYAHAPNTAMWREGVKVKGKNNLTKGTAIATFSKGRYPNVAHGNHAALYIGQDRGGIYVMDQWNDPVKKPKISQRYLPFKGKNRNGSFPDPSNNGDAFSVIE